ncbi:reverse transcriptase domain-containing protein [Tanacetum coccineum]
MPRAWRLYLSREACKEGLSVGMILLDPDEKMHSYAIRLNFDAPDYIMDYEALLAGLIASASKGMKDLHVFINSKILVDQVEGSRTPAMKKARKYREDIMDSSALFHKFQITHLPKKIKLQSRSVNRACNHKVGIPQSRSIDGNQNKTISQGGKRRKRGKSNKQGTNGKAKLQLEN